MAGCFVSLIMVMAIIGVCVYFVFPHKNDEQELKQLKANQTTLLEEIHNLTNLKNKLTSDFDFQVYNLTQQKTNLTIELSQVKNKNQELETEKKKLSEHIETVKKTLNEQKFRQAKIIKYCLTGNNNERKYGSCEQGWSYCGFSCYAVNNAKYNNRKTWEEARKNCQDKSSDLTVTDSEKEKIYVNDISWHENGIEGYWIGLIAVAGKWKWIDGSELNNQAWIKQNPATDGQCVKSLSNQGWASVRCNEKNAWICEKTPVEI